jgi:hypothetical protein
MEHMNEESAFEALDREIRKLELKQRAANPNWDLYPADEAKIISLRSLLALQKQHPENTKIAEMISDVVNDRVKPVVSRPGMDDSPCLVCEVPANLHTAETMQACAMKLFTGGNGEND